jgi:hypothetical protein
MVFNGETLMVVVVMLVVIIIIIIIIIHEHVIKCLNIGLLLLSLSSTFIGVSLSVGRRQLLSSLSLFTGPEIF